MDQLYLIRHAKSSWADPALEDFDRPLSARGKRDGAEMAKRLGSLNFSPDLLVSSPSRRAKKTAKIIAKGMGYRKKEIKYIDFLYFGSLEVHLKVLKSLSDLHSTLFLVGHNHVITELGEYLTGHRLGNVPTAGVVAIGFNYTGACSLGPGTGDLLFFDFPKNTSWAGYQ